MAGGERRAPNGEWPVANGDCVLRALVVLGSFVVGRLWIGGNGGVVQSAGGLVVTGGWSLRMNQHRCRAAQRVVVEAGIGIDRLLLRFPDPVRRSPPGPSPAPLRCQGPTLPAA